MSASDRIIRVSDAVYCEIVGRIIAYGETPDSILRSVFGLPERLKEPRAPRRPRKPPDYYGLLLRSIRDARGWTQLEIASKLNVTTSAVSHWETGRYEPLAKYGRQIVKLAERSGIETGGKKERDDGQDGIR